MRDGFFFDGMRTVLKILLYFLSAFLLVAPIAAWFYLVSLGCAYNTSNSSCGVRLVDYWDDEFFLLAALPWALAAVLIFLARRRA